MDLFILCTTTFNTSINFVLIWCPSRHSSLCSTIVNPRKSGDVRLKYAPAMWLLLCINSLCMPSAELPITLPRSIQTLVSQHQTSLPAELPDQLGEKATKKKEFVCSGISKILNLELVIKTRSCPIKILNKYKWLHTNNHNNYCWNNLYMSQKTIKVQRVMTRIQIQRLFKKFPTGAFVFYTTVS